MRLLGRNPLSLFLLAAFPLFSSAEEINVLQRMGMIGVPFEERELFSQYGGFGVSVHVSLRSAADPAEKTGSVAVAVPLSSSSFTQEVLIAFIEKMREASPHRIPVDVKAAFLADEYSSLPVDMRKNIHIGLEDLCAVLPPETILLYLDFAAPPQKLVFAHGAKGWVTPLGAVKPLPALCKRMDVPYIFAASNNAFFRLGLMDGQEVVGLAGEQGINAVFISDNAGIKGAVGANAPADSADAANTAPSLTVQDIASLLVDYVETVEWTDSQTDDTHFVIMTNADRQARFISETNLVVTTLAGAALLLIIFLTYSIVKRRLFIVKFRIFLAYSWVLLLFAALFFAVLEGVGIFVSFVSRSVHIFDVWTALLKIVIGFLTYSLIASLFDKLKIPGKQRFFGSAALLLGVVNLLVIIFIDIDLAPIFAVCLACIAVGAVPNLAIVCYISAFLLPLQSIGLFIEFLGNSELIKTTTDVRVNFAITSCILPIWFVLKRGTLLLNTSLKRQKSVFSVKPKIGFLIRTAFLLVFLFTAALILFYRLNPIQTEPARRVLESENSLVLDVKESVLLERRIYKVSVQAEGKPCRFDVALEANAADVLRDSLYFCSAPLRFNDGRIELVLGENPPNPFLFEIVFGDAAPLDDFVATLRVDAVYAVYDPRIAEKPETDALTVKGSRELR
jgi:hypothetical protein